MFVKCLNRVDENLLKIIAAVFGQFLPFFFFKAKNTFERNWILTGFFKKTFSNELRNIRVVLDIHASSLVTSFIYIEIAYRNFVHNDRNRTFSSEGAALACYVRPGRLKGKSQKKQSREFAC